METMEIFFLVSFANYKQSSVPFSCIDFRHISATHIMIIFIVFVVWRSVCYISCSYTIQLYTYINNINAILLLLAILCLNVNQRHKWEFIVDFYGCCMKNEESCAWKAWINVQVWPAKAISLETKKK